MLVLIVHNIIVVVGLAAVVVHSSLARFWNVLYGNKKRS